MATLLQKQAIFVQAQLTGKIIVLANLSSPPVKKYINLITAILSPLSFKFNEVEHELFFSFYCKLFRVFPVSNCLRVQKT